MMNSESFSVADAIVKILEDMGVQYAFGIAGGGIATVWDALEHSSIQVVHCRHESGAAFAAIEAHFASNRPVAVFTTTGPGITNVLTGMAAACCEGAKVICISAATSAPQRGQWAFQETSIHTMPSEGIFTSGLIFHYAITLEYSEQLSKVYRRLALGFAQPGGFVAHLSIPTNIQKILLEASSAPVSLCSAPTAPSEETIADYARLLSQGSFAIWVGFGARGAAAEIRQLAERTGAAVMCSPRAKGIFPEDHPQFVGVTGFAGHESVYRYMQEYRPLRVLVLGTRLGEYTSLWNPTMIPSRGFLHVDIDPHVPGVVYPATPIISEVGVFMKLLLKYIPESRPTVLALPHPQPNTIKPSAGGLVRPQVLMSFIQQVMVERSNAVVMAEAGNSFCWALNLLRFPTPGRFRTSTGFASMGHFSCGVIGAALAHNDNKAVAIVGDGAMLMNNEISTAVKDNIPAIWIVLNDARYNMCGQGMEYLGYEGADVTIPQVDFLKIAQAMGADGIRVESESDIQAALEKAMAATNPFVVDVIIDPTQIPPSETRNQNLI